MARDRSADLDYGTFGWQRFDDEAGDIEGQRCVWRTIGRSGRTPESRRAADAPTLTLRSALLAGMRGQRSSRKKWWRISAYDEGTMARTGPTTLMLPPFSGATRKLILASVAMFFALAALSLVSGGFANLLTLHLSLVPALVARGELWQLVTYPFVNVGLLSTVFALLTLWFIGPMLESSFGERWLYELFFASAIGGGLQPARSLASDGGALAVPELAPARPVEAVDSVEDKPAFESLGDFDRGGFGHGVFLGGRWCSASQ